MGAVVTPHKGGNIIERITTHRGTTVSYERYGSGLPLVLVHGSFSDHITNWQEAKPLLQNS